MRRRARSPVTAGTLISVLTMPLMACQPTDYSALVTNQLTTSVQIWHSEPGKQPTAVADRLPPGRNLEYGLTRFDGPDACEPAAQLVAVTPQGIRYVFGPPLCAQQTWVLLEPSPWPTPKP